MDELLISEEAIVQLSRKLERLNNLSTLNKDSFDIIHPPTIDINIESLVNAVEDDPRFKSLLGLERQRAASINPYQNGKRLRFFLRKEFDVLASNRDETVAGVRFSVPIVFADRPNYQRKLNQLDNEYNIDQWQRIQRVRDSYNSFQNQLDRVITQQYRYLRSKEKMNRVINRHHLDEPMLISAVMARLINYMDASIELVNTKRELYERANAVFLSARVPFSADFIGQVPVTIKNYRSRPFSRAAYIWSRTFNQTDNDRILLVSKTQGYDRLYLSYSQNIDLTKLEQFLAETENSGLKVELMISDNALFQPSNHVKAASKVAALSRLANAIHLDIEPQATSEYDDNRLKYQQDYIQMLSVIRQQLPDIQLTAALPFHWELDTYAAAHTFLDKIVIMNYENNKADTLTRRMKRILTQVPLEKLSMAVRPKDFASPFQLEEVLAVVNQASGINDFAFHKFAEVIELKEVNQ